MWICLERDRLDEKIVNQSRMWLCVDGHGSAKGCVLVPV